jgi:hypothetical protein
VLQGLLEGAGVREFLHQRQRHAPEGSGLRLQRKRGVPVRTTAAILNWAALRDRMRIELILLIACSTVLACAKFPVQPYGRDTYVVYVDSTNPAKARRVAVENANRHCSDLGLRMVPDSESSSMSGSVWRGPVATVQFIFRCLSDSDPANQRPIMRPTPTE